MRVRAGMRSRVAQAGRQAGRHHQQSTDDHDDDDEDDDYRITVLVAANTVRHN